MDTKSRSFFIILIKSKFIMHLSTQESVQIQQIISNLYTSSKKIPFAQTLLQHPVYGQIFSTFDKEKMTEVEGVITARITDFLGRLNTKWWQLFSRLLEIDPEKFRSFRNLNADEEYTQMPEFQVLWRRMEDQLFKLEWILTAQMLKKSQGLDKTVWAFYEIAYAVFPYLDRVESE